MTLDDIARTHHLETALGRRLGLPPESDAATTLISLAWKQGLSPFEYPPPRISMQ
jgi:hypothetical protein